MMEVKIKNKIEEKVNEYQEKTGATKTWIARQMGYNSPQALDKAMKNLSNSLEVYYKFAVFLNCMVEYLYSVEVFKENNLIFSTK